MTPNWRELADNFSAWASALDDLLADARNSLQGAGGRRSDEIARDLREFVTRSPDHMAGVRELDDIAIRTIRSLNRSDIDKALTALEARNAELTAATKRVRTVTATATAAASTIRLDNVTRIVEAATRVVTSAEALKRDLSGEAGSDAVIADLDTGIAAVRDLSAKVEAVRHRWVPQDRNGR